MSLYAMQDTSFPVMFDYLELQLFRIIVCLNIITKWAYASVHCHIYIPKDALCVFFRVLFLLPFYLLSEQPSLIFEEILPWEEEQVIELKWTTQYHYNYAQHWKSLGRASVDIVLPSLIYVLLPFYYISLIIFIRHCTSRFYSWFMHTN